MDIRTSTPSYNFKAVRMSPDPEKWNQQVLNAVLNSNFVKDVVKEDVKNNRDTFISYADHFDPPLPDNTRFSHMFVNIIGNNKDVTLGTHSTYRYDSAQLFRKAKERRTGSTNLSKDLAELIQNLDTPEENESKQIPNNPLKELRKLAGGIVYEPQIAYQKFKH